MVFHASQALCIRLCASVLLAGQALAIESDDRFEANLIASHSSGELLALERQSVYVSGLDSPRKSYLETELYLRLFDRYPEMTFYLRQAGERAQHSVEIGLTKTASLDDGIFARLSILSVYHQFGDEEKFAQLLEESLEKYPNDARLQLAKAVSSAEQNEWADAFRFFEKALHSSRSLKPAEGDIVRQRIYRTLSEVNPPLWTAQRFRKWLDKEPHRDLALSIAKTYVAARQDREAWEIVKNFKAAPVDALTLISGALAYRLNKQSSPYEQAFAQGLEKNNNEFVSENRQEIYSLLGSMAYSKKQTTKAHQLWATGAVYATDIETYYARLAVLHMKKKAYKDLQKVTEELLTVRPGEPLLIASLAEVCAELGESSSKILALYDDAIALDDERSEFYNGRAAIYEKMAQYPLAIRDFEKVLLLDPTDIAARMNAASLYKKTGNPLAAERLLREGQKTPFGPMEKTSSGAALAH